MADRQDLQIICRFYVICANNALKASESLFLYQFSSVHLLKCLTNNRKVSYRQALQETKK
jgi:hypothetical protein